MGYWKNILPKGLFNWLETTRKNTIGKPQLTYSGEGEDLILERLVKHQRAHMLILAATTQR